MAGPTAEARHWILTSRAKHNISQAKTDALLRCNRPAKEIGVALILLQERPLSVGAALKQARRILAPSIHNKTASARIS